ncbi:MAG: PilZ domain-containing protein [Anaerolineae bacterium]|nr:PilZ domain-containing protein [Anaerolineae bacterium]
MVTGYYQIFKDVFEKKETIKLMNVFQGVPVSHDATILEVRGAEIRVQTHPLQLICIRNQKQTYINSRALIYRATALSADIHKETALLTDFDLTREIGFRKSIRVEPPGPIKVSLYDNKPGSNPNGLLTLMADISIHGMSVCMKSFLFNISPLLYGDSVNLRFNLPDNDKNTNSSIYIQAILRNIRVTDDKTIRLGFEFLANAANEGFITRFVAQRQKNVLKELKRIYDEESSLHL